MTRRQKKTLKAVAIIAAAFAVFVIFVYIPMARELSALKRDYDGTISDIGQIMKVVSGGASLEGKINKLNARLEVLNNMFPSKEEVILNTLSEAAARSKVDVISISPGKKRVIKEIGKDVIAVKACSVQQMDVAMTIRADYKMLNDFAREVREDFPVYIKFDYIGIEKASSDKHPILKVELKMHSYLICAE